MASGILKPLAVFCSQSQSQRYIKTIRNLGDAWRTLAEEPITESDRKFAFIETTFDFTLRITNGLEDATSVEVLSPFPLSDLEHYNAWVDCYSGYFKTRYEDTKDYTANMFLSASEEVAWNVAGYLLAWRIAISPQIGSIQYSTGNSKYLLEKGNETSVTVQSLKDQVELLTKGEPTD
ncbi:uncharacterized protein N7496_001176 [Penicillium cataractarum]|uniref:Uncharacterized protein n=1 Tax=Penicillium cataractarum TaxID=2100454 RepID=A0A9X0B6N8_9EURO|nr:uncharacterized protein N7496_001176 [Penicillium cataractarum]KAJ5390108.1 hypothetical protein N7496_001176 [Penicillium cataractarum]